jgi:uncharacterized protein YrzB (UPF0473 family)
MTGKFNSLKDQVVYRASLDGTNETLGDVEVYGSHATKVEDFHGKDYIVIEDAQGFVSVEVFEEHIDIDGEVGGGYFCPVERRWEEVSAAYNEFYDEDLD